MVGITEFNNVTMDNITSVLNMTNPTDFFINVNNTIYGGWLFFILLLAFWIILYLAAQDFKDQILNNVMYSGAVISILSLLLRALFITKDGVIIGLLTDMQLWIFPLITVLSAVIIWATKET